MILLKKLLRTAWNYKAQFISMILMVALGMGIFIGFNLEWKSIEKSTNRFFDLTGYSDYRIINTNPAKPTGYTAEDLNKVKSINGVDNATRYLNVTVTDSLNLYDDKNHSSLDLSVMDSYASPIKFLIVDGTSYDMDSDGFYLSDKYANANGYKVGDNLTISYNGVTVTKEIKALIKCGEHMICVNEDAGQLMPDYKIYGFVYTTPKVLEEILEGVFPGTGIKEYYTKIMVESTMSTEDMEDALNLAFGVNTYTLLDKDNSTAYKQSRGEMDEGKTMGNFLPVIFLAIAVLTMITTMHRIAVNEKIQIGTLKALGFKDRKILMHYTSYGLFIGLVGGLIGAFLGVLIEKIVMSPTGMMGTYFDLDKWPVGVPAYIIILSVLIILFLAFITFLSIRKMLKGTASDALRPYVPKKHKPLLIEKTKVFDKLSFSGKWNIRDVFRNKVRSLMTIFGIAGATLLMLASFAFQKTFDSFISNMDNDMMKYSTAINIQTGTPKEKSLELIEALDCDYIGSKAVKINEEKEYINFSVVNNTKGYYGVIDKNNHAMTLSNDGIYVSQAVARDSKVKTGDVIELNVLSMSGTKTYSAKIIGIITSFTSKSIMATEEFASTLKEINTNEVYDFEITNLYTNKNKDDVISLDTNKIVSSMNSKDEILKTFDKFTEIMDIMIYILVIFSVVLAVVVLYNLGVMSYFERYRQLATLKVVGFKDKTIGKILITQNLWLTIIGLIIGIPLGMFALHMLILLLASEYELTVYYGAISFVLTIIIIFATSMLVSLVVARKNRKINMVEALKGIE